MKAQQKDKKLWKNQRIIDQNGLIRCEQRERLFQNTECAYLFQDLLKIYQQKSLPLHYMRYSFTNSQQNQIITYKAYVDFNCPKKDKKEKQRIVGQFHIHYRIVRLDKEKLQCQYPYLLLFYPTCGELVCPDCNISRLYRITQSSFYVIRTQFIYQIIRKITFMEKYPNYIFTPHSFTSTVQNGQTVFEYIKDHNYEPSYYFQQCESVLAHSLKLELLKRNMDCQSMRLDELFKDTEEKPAMLKHTTQFKLKYMCMKCPGKEIWTTREKVNIYYCIVDLEDVFKQMVDRNSQLGRKQIFQGSAMEKKYTPLSQKTEENEERLNPEQKTPIQTLFETQQRRLDRSIQSEVEQHEQFQRDFKTFISHHQNLQSYTYPYLVLYEIKVPKMSCRRCQKEKDGLIYITNLIDEAHSILNDKILRRISQLHQIKKSKGQECL